MWIFVGFLVFWIFEIFEKNLTVFPLNQKIHGNIRKIDLLTKTFQFKIVDTFVVFHHDLEK
jgi:hypothetical protein